MSPKNAVAVDVLPVLAAHANALMWASEFHEAAQTYGEAAGLAREREEWQRELSLLRLAWLCYERAAGRRPVEDWDA